LEHLGKALGDQQRGVDEAVDAVAQTRLGGVVQLGARLTDALLPADLVELVYLGGNGNGKCLDCLYDPIGWGMYEMYVWGLTCALHFMFNINK